MKIPLSPSQYKLSTADSKQVTGCSCGNGRLCMRGVVVCPGQDSALSVATTDDLLVIHEWLGGISCGIAGEQTFAERKQEAHAVHSNESRQCECPGARLSCKS